MPVLAQTLRPSSMETESKIQIQNLDKQHDNRRPGRPIKKGFKNNNNDDNNNEI